MSALSDLRKEVRSYAKPARAKISLRFFKTGPGQYGEGDKFLGLVVPECRHLAKKHHQLLSLAEAVELLKSEIHEERLLALFILTLKFNKGGDSEKQDVYKAYCRSTKWINNWDLVDTSAPHIVGAYLQERDRAQLYEWVESKDLWERRISILSTQAFIRKGYFEDTLKISELLLGDEHDLIHKAVGWMLREVGKKDRKAEMGFLNRHAKRMPRTMLRYALEHFPEKTRRLYMSR